MTVARRVIGWSLGLWRLASGRIRADWRFLAGVWLLLACATTLLAAGVVYGDAVAVGSLRASIRGAPAANQGVSVESALSPAEVAAADERVRSAIGAALAPAASPTIALLRSGSLVRAGAAASGSSTPTLTLLESVDDLPSHATLVDGRWPEPNQDPVEAVVSRAAAATLGVRIGDRVPLGDASVPGADPNHPVVTLVVVGIDEPVAADPAWAGSALELTGSGRLNGSSFEGPFLASPADLLEPGRFARVDATWRATLDLDRTVADDIEPLRAHLTALPDAVHGAFPAGRSVAVNVGLKGLLDGVDRSLQVARGAVFLLTLQFAVVAVYAVLLVAGMLTDRRRPEIGLLRSRGASTAHIVTLAFGEAVLLAVPAAAAAPFLATGLVRLLGAVGPLSTTGAVGNATITPSVVTAVAITGLIAALVLTLPALAAGAEVAGIRAVLGRPIARTFAQRLGIDVALVVVAGLAIWQLRTYGAPLTRTANGSLGFDPLLIAAPAFGLVAGGVLATRLVPRLGEAGERVLDHGRGLVSPLGARQIARRPLRYTRAALLLMLSAALGTFGAVYA
ncbi:MAG TPA: FtsX-like permease family protein, partial [Candidatus Limnocylindrales bacterium]|nr:FtsX-like permease family protein [Candidatus Limnocylindrales bacterium]